MKIGTKEISENSDPYIIAEAGINHNGSIQTAKELIDVAKNSGADAVKFQKRELEETYVEDIVKDPAIAEMGVEYTVSNLKEVVLSDAQFRELAEYARNAGIDFLCSPWDESSVEFLESIDMPAYKIGSPDMTNFVLLEKIIETEKPIIISTGMSDEEEIDKTVDFLERHNAEFAVLHCRSTYPAPFHNLNLNFMNKLMEKYDAPIGYSGHERGIAISAAAATMGASIIERHFTLDRTMEGPDHSASLEPTGLKKLVRDIENIEESKGSEVRYMTRGEYNNRVSLSKSLVASRKIDKGQEIKREDLTAKSPAKGISPQELYNIVGEKAQRNLSEDQIIQWEDIEKKEERRYDTSLEDWGVVVRFSDIEGSDWGDPDVYEFRVNGADLEEEIEISDHKDKRLTVHAPEQKGHDIVDLSSTTEDERKRAEEIIQNLIDKVRNEIKPHFSKENDPMIVIHPGGITSEKMVLDQTEEMNKQLAKTMDNLDDEGVELLLENMPPLPWIYGGQQYHNNFMRADEIAEYCEKHNQKICYDTAHAKLWCNYSDTSLKEHMEKLKPHIEYLHIADAAGVDGEGLQIEEGEIDWKELAPILNTLNVPKTTEIWRGHEKNAEGFKKAAKRLENFLN
ncbi:N-acetylneuraminate synthase family protein [Candidatus Nanohalococcus occultus]|uniref:N-acetylneuraminate synthase n=1 Tax=Candidatus Nanohalococcus occultus TaxID=2978047 RepID=A0ABY8CFT7_9ARCH|nr:N-acetylneuraminate synthase [Candidatus Nanohaloarchaeota archaeon SVXNc]